MIDALAKTFRDSRLPSITANGVLDTPVLEAALEMLESLAFERFDLADRGAYEASQAIAPGDVEGALVDLASAVSGLSLEARARRWYRLSAGDYTLAKDDRWAREAGLRGADEAWFDLTLDLSIEPTGEGEVVFTHRGAAFFTVPQRLGQIGLVARGPTVARFDRYLTFRVGDRRVDRLRLLLVERGTRSA